MEQERPALRYSTPEAQRFIHDLFGQYGDGISDLEVRRASLEDAYMSLVRRFESGQGESAAREFEGAVR